MHTDPVCARCRAAILFAVAMLANESEEMVGKLAEYRKAQSDRVKSLSVHLQ